MKQMIFRHPFFLMHSYPEVTAAGIEDRNEKNWFLCKKVLKNKKNDDIMNKRTRRAGTGWIGQE